MQYTIKQMETKSEVEGKAYVHWKSWQETYPGLIDDAYLKRMSLEKCMEIAHRWPDNILVAKDGEKVAGFIGYGAYRDGSLGAAGEIYGLYVLQAYQGRKIGFELMNEAIQRLERYNTIALWVLKGNWKAIRFYERYGFRFDGISEIIQLGTSNTELRMTLKR